MNVLLLIVLLGFVLSSAACGTDDRERVEDAVRSRGNVAGIVDAVTCSEASAAWGCRVRLRDGRTQACQAKVDDGRVTGVACQPLRGE